MAVLVALLIAPMVVSAEGEDAGEWAKVVQARLGLRVRSGPSLVDSISHVLYNGQEVKVVGEPVWNQGIRWVELDFDRWDGVHVSGWCASAYLDNYPSYDEPYDGYAGEQGYKVTPSIGLRLRAGPGLEYAVKRIVPYGAVLERTDTAAAWRNGLEWVQLELNGAQLWAAKRYLLQVP
jgi:uncharacterized protein YraI